MARLQIALDFANKARALKAAAEAVRGGADIIEAGTPLIKSEGLDVVRGLRAAHPAVPIVADMKTMDAGRAEMEMAAKAGATIAVVMGASSDSTIKECVEAGRNYGVEIAVDLLGVADPTARARQIAEWGAAYVDIHTPIDEQMRGGDPFTVLRAVREAVDISIAVAGGINSETAADAVAAGADVVIVGGAVIKSPDIAAATASLKEAMTSGEKVASELFKRVGPDRIVEVLSRVSTANVTDAMHHRGAISGIFPVVDGSSVAGPAFTVRTYPGDWAKPVEAIDLARPGDVIVVDAGGVPPAVWGELATHSAMRRGIAAVVINGAVRDTPVIRETGFPAFARTRSPAPGEPKGMGEVSVALTIEGVNVSPGDWVVGDDDGIVVVPSASAVEVANRAQDRMEYENRLRHEIDTGGTLGTVEELVRWEKTGRRRGEGSD